MSCWPVLDKKGHKSFSIMWICIAWLWHVFFWKLILSFIVLPQEVVPDIRAPGRRRFEDKLISGRVVLTCAFGWLRARGCSRCQPFQMHLCPMASVFLGGSAHWIIFVRSRGRIFTKTEVKMLLIYRPRPENQTVHCWLLELEEQGKLEMPVCPHP